MVLNGEARVPRFVSEPASGPTEEAFTKKTEAVGQGLAASVAGVATMIAAFAMPALGAYGNTGRNALLGPNSVNTNLALFKNFPLPLREGMHLQFRSEFFNALNAVNLNSPNTTLSALANMGRITGAAEARVIQFALKLVF